MENKTPKQVNLEEMDLVQLKAMVYDQLMIREQTDNNLRILREEISKRYELEEIK